MSDEAKIVEHGESSELEYFVYKAKTKQTFGPVTKEIIKKWISQNRVFAEDFVCIKRTEDWIPLSQSWQLGFGVQETKGKKKVGSEERVIGLVMLFIGLPLALFGVLISFTVIGAIIGIPMVLIGGSLFGWGFVKLFG